MKTRFFLIIIFAFVLNAVNGQISPYDKPSYSTYTPLSTREILAPALIMKQRYDNNAAKVDALIKYVFELKSKTNDKDFLAYLDQCLSTLKKLYDFDLARMDKEIRNFEFAIQEGVNNHINRINKNAYCQQGLKEAEGGFYDLAIAYYQKALEIDADYDWAYNLMGVAYYELKKYDQAIKCYQKALLINSDYVAVYINLGNVYGDLKDTEKQINYYKRAARLGSDPAQDWLKKAGYSW